MSKYYDYANELIGDMAGAFGGLSQVTTGDLARALAGRVNNAGGFWADLQRPHPGTYHRPDEPPLPNLIAFINILAHVYLPDEVWSEEEEAATAAEILAAYEATRIARGPSDEARISPARETNMRGHRP